METQRDQTTVSRDRARPVFIGLAVLTVIIAFVVAGREWSTPHVQPSADEVKAEYLKIPPPSVALAERTFEVRSKSGAVSVTNRHSINISAGALLGEYRKVLTERGWKYRKSFGDGRHWGDDYCKGNLLASVEVMRDQGQQVEYVFSVSWSGVSERECS